MATADREDLYLFLGAKSVEQIQLFVSDISVQDSYFVEPLHADSELWIPVLPCWNRYFGSILEHRLWFAGPEYLLEQNIPILLQVVNISRSDVHTVLYAFCKYSISVYSCDISARLCLGFAGK